MMTAHTSIRTILRGLPASLLMAGLLLPLVVTAAPFTYKPAGDLKSGSGTGLKTSKNYMPGIRFPIEKAPAYLNSQVYMPGGMHGGGGGQCSGVNYAYPWRDNYCEKRSWKMPLCPAGKGHQGQDMRPASCKDNTWWCVAAEAGTITSIGSYTVYLKGVSGTTHRYLHMQMSALAIKKGQKVSKGQKLGRVSNDFGGTSTTIHLHYDVQQYVSGVGTVFVSPYNALVAAYKTLIGQGSSCNASACAAKSKCGSWGKCGGFSSACDETGTRKRTCTKWACAGGKCVSSTTSESQGCKIDTDGKVVQGWSAWGSCGGFSGPCDGSGTHKRSRVVCKAGKASPETAKKACTVPTDGKVVQGWSAWSACTGSGGSCDSTGQKSRSRSVCKGGKAVKESAKQACSVNSDGKVVQPWGAWSACVGIDGPCDLNGQQSRSQVVCASGEPNKQTDLQPCARTTEGVVVEDWGPWGPCLVGADGCNGQQARKRVVCQGGAAKHTVEKKACTGACGGNPPADTASGSDDAQGQGVADGQGDGVTPPLTDGVVGDGAGGGGAAVHQLGAAPSSGCSGGGRSGTPLGIALLLAVLVMLGLRRRRDVSVVAGRSEWL